MKAFILWKKIEGKYIYGIMSNFTKKEIGWIDECGNERYYPIYDDYEDISDDYEEEKEPRPRQLPNGRENISEADWNRYQQRKHYKNLRENLNNSSNPEYTRPQQSNEIQFSPLQHNSKVQKGVSDLMRQAQERQQANDRKIIESKVYKQVQRQNPALLAASVFGSAGYGMSDNHPNDGKYKIKELKTKVENKINNLEKELENLKGEDKIEMKFRIKELKTAIKELEILLKSSSSFDIKTSSTPLLDYNPETNTIIVEYDGHEGSLLNELKHAYQFENKKIDFIKTENGIIPGYLYDIYDEVETYKRQYAYDGILELRLSWTEAEANKFLELNKIDMFSKFEITGEPENSVGILKIKSSKLINPDIIFKVKDGVDDKTVLYTTLSKKSLDANSSMKKISKLNHKRVDLKNIPRLNIEEFKNKKISYKEFIQIINNLSPFIYVK